MIGMVGMVGMIGKPKAEVIPAVIIAKLGKGMLMIFRAAGNRAKILFVVAGVAPRL